MSGLVSVISLLLSPGSWRAQGFVCVLQESLFPPGLWKFCNQIPLSFKIRFPGDSQSLCWILRLGSLTWGLEPLQQYENFFGVIVLQFVGRPPTKYGIWFYCDCTPPTVSLWLIFCSRTWGMFLWWVTASVPRRKSKRTCTHLLCLSSLEQ